MVVEKQSETLLLALTTVHLIQVHQQVLHLQELHSQHQVVNMMRRMHHTANCQQILVIIQDLAIVII